MAETCSCETYCTAWYNNFCCVLTDNYIFCIWQYKYLGSIINDSKSIEEKIKDKIALGTKAYHANKKFLKSRLVTKYSKLKLYRTVIRPIVTYASETWVLKETIIQKLLYYYRWEDNIKQDICQMKIKNWIACVQGRGKWKEVVEKGKTFSH